MAGGYGSGAGIPLAQRVRSQSRPPIDRASAPAVGGRHCWVTTFGDQPIHAAGLLLEWRQRATSATWEARVVFSLEQDSDDWVSIEAWLPAAAVEPLTTQPGNQA